MQGHDQAVPRARTGAAGKGQSPGQHSLAAPLQHPKGELRSELRQSLPTNAVTKLKLQLELSWSDFAKPTTLQSAVQRLKTAFPWFLRT